MKTIWQLTYETIPGNGEQIKKFKSFVDAKKEIKALISQVYIQPYTEAIREEGTHKSYRAAMAEFLSNYMSRTDFLSADESIPSDNPDDYGYEKNQQLRDYADEDMDDEDWYGKEEDIDELDDFDIDISKDSLSFECYYEGKPFLKTDMVVMDDDKKVYSFLFHVDGAPRDKFREIYNSDSSPIFGNFILSVVDSSNIGKQHGAA